MRNLFRTLALLALIGCSNPPPRPDSPTVDIGIKQNTPGLNVPPPGDPVDTAEVTNGAIKSVTLLAKTGNSWKVRFKCPDGSEHDVDVPLPSPGSDGRPVAGPFVDTGCTLGGKPVRVRVTP